MSIEAVRHHLCESIAYQEKGLQESKAALAALGNAKDEVKPAVKAFIAGEPAEGGEKEPESPPIIKIPDSVVVQKGQSFQDACNEAKGGSRCVVVPKGMVMPAQKISGIGDKPFWLRAEEPGEASVSGLMPKKNWRHVRDGIYEADHDGEPWAGHCNGAYLFHFNTPEDLARKSVKVHDRWAKKDIHVKHPGYGFSHSNGKVFVRLPDNADPGTKNLELTSGFGQKLVTIEKSSGLILDGMRLIGSGDSEAIACSSPGVELRNNVIHISKFGARLADDCLMSWTEFSYPGFRQWVRDLMRANGGNIVSCFKLVKLHFSNHGNARIEGGLGVSPKEASRNVEFHHNFNIESFEFHRLGEFVDSIAHHEVSLYAADDFCQFESWRGNHPASGLKLEDCLSLNAGGAHTSHQDRGGQIKTGQEINRCVFATTDPELGIPSYLIKDMELKAAKGIKYRDCLFHSPMVGSTDWGSTKWLILADRKKSNPEKIDVRDCVVVMGKISSWQSKDKPNTDRNVVFSQAPSKEIQGPNGRYAGKGISEAWPNWDDWNQAPDDLNFAPSVDLGAGPFKPGDKMPWRPLERAFSDEMPERWEG